MTIDSPAARTPQEPAREGIAHYCRLLRTAPANTMSAAMIFMKACYEISSCSAGGFFRHLGVEPGGVDHDALVRAFGDLVHAVVRGQ